ncbi:hypothetical protein FRB99_002246 [Tulasnella sp. 403]|nr:hypothetical protein FRB99_002246 [Tulasnella sp. 403]
MHDIAVNVAERISQAAIRRLISLKQHRNSLLPLSRLPVEILQHIFFEALCVTDIGCWAKEYYRQLGQFRLVCTDWRRFIDETPAFWVYTSDEIISSSEMSTILSRSRDLPLHIQFGSTRASSGPTYVHDMLAHSHRWSSITIRMNIFPWYLDRSRDLLTRAAPLLTSLYIRVPPNATSVCVSDTLFNDNAPNLQHVNIEFFTIPWSSPVLSGLCSLYISGSLVTCPSVSQILGIVSVSPGLSSLRLAWFALVEMPDNDLHTYQPVRTHKLVEVELRALPETATHQLLEWLILPPHACLSVSHKCSRWPAPTLQPVRDHIATFQGWIGPPVVEFQVSMGTLQLKCGQGVVSYTLDCSEHSVPYTDAFHALFSWLPASQRNLPTIMVIHSPFDNIAPLSLLTHANELFPVLDELRVYLDLASLDVILNELSTGTNPAHAHLLPKLRKLQLRITEDGRLMEPLVVPIEKFLSARGPFNEPGAVGGMVVLEELQFQSMYVLGRYLEGFKVFGVNVVVEDCKIIDDQDQSSSVCMSQ